MKTFNTGETHESLKNKYNPDGSDLRNLQLRLINILDFIDRICRENGLQYFLSSGTLLGAVRHGGFIPWDDDLDIYMPLKDLKRLRKIMKKSPNPQFFHECHENDRNYYTPFDKIVDTHTIFRFKTNNKFADLFKYKGLWVDIFPIEKTPLAFQKISFYTYNWGIRFHGTKGGLLFKLISKIRHYSNQLLIFPILRGINLFLRNTKYNKTLGNGYFFPIPEDYIFPLKDIEFEGKTYMGPCEPHKVLALLYGKNYMNLPDEEKRMTHSFTFKVIE